MTNNWFSGPEVPTMGPAVGKILTIDIVSLNRQNTTKNMKYGVNLEESVFRILTYKDRASLIQRYLKIDLKWINHREKMVKVIEYL